MSAFFTNAQDAILFQLQAALEQYGTDMDRLVDSWLDMDLYRSVSEQAEEIRHLVSIVPSLGVAWVELLIAHAELIHCLWRNKFAAGDPRVNELRVRHAEAVGTLRRQCMRVLLHPHEPIGPEKTPRLYTGDFIARTMGR